jgi:hypothetical protein
MTSPLDNVNVRRMLLTIKQHLQNFASEPNDEVTRMGIVKSTNEYLDVLRNAGNLVDYKVKADRENNTLADIEAGRLNVDIYIKPIIPIIKTKLRPLTAEDFLEPKWKTELKDQIKEPLRLKLKLKPISLKPPKIIPKALPLPDAQKINKL